MEATMEDKEIERSLEIVKKDYTLAILTNRDEERERNTRIFANKSYEDAMKWVIGVIVLGFLMAVLKLVFIQ